MLLSMEDLVTVKKRVLQSKDMMSVWQWALLVFVVHRAWRYYQNYVRLSILLNL
jgi:hypothetical protein